MVLRCDACGFGVVMGVIALCVAGLMTMFGGIGAPARGRGIPRTTRDGLAALLAGAMAASVFVESGPRLAFAVAAVAGMALVVALGRDRGLIATAVAAGLAATVGVARPDQLSHSGGIVILEPRAFVLWWTGAAVACWIVATAMFLDRSSEPAAEGRFASLGLALIAAMLAAPSLGAFPRSVLVTVPAFGILVVRAAGRPLMHWTTLLLLPATAGAHLLSVFATDRLLQVQHVPAPHTNAGAYVIGALLLCVAGAPLLRRDVVDRGLWSRPHLRAGLVACVVAAFTAIAGLQSGAFAAVPILIVAAATQVAVLLSPELR